MEGGAELLVHHAQLALELNTSWALLKTDMSNAFNSVSRSQLLHQVETSFPELLPHVRQMYAEASDLLYQMESETVLITSEEGVHQGDPLGPSLFSLAIHPIVSQLQRDHHNVRILAYLDDIFILGEPDNAIDAGLALKASLSNIGLSICDGKCELFTPNPLVIKSCPSPPPGVKFWDYSFRNSFGKPFSHHFKI